MSKKKVFIIALLVCCIAIAATGSLAYFTASEQAHNVITTGSVKISLQELARAEGEDGELVPFENLEGIMPGAECSKIVQVKNEGKNAAWVRLSVEKAIELAAGISAEPDLGLISMDIDLVNWLEQDGYYYYLKPLEPGETTEPLFTEVRFDKDMGNDFKGCTISLGVKAYAVQTANNGDSVLEAKGWPEPATV